MKKSVAWFLLAILFASSVSAAIIYVPQNFSTIQAAIDNANSGDIIIVDNGTYNEQLTINKSNLVIQSSDDASSTIINLGQPTETTGIWVLANNTLFSGFTVKNISTVSSRAQYAIRVRGNNNTISNNIIIGQSSRDWWSDEEDSATNLDGTTTAITANNIVENNEIYDFSAMGIQVVGSGGNYNSWNNTIRNNYLHDIDYYAIANDRSANQTITNNTLVNIGPSGHAADGFPAVGIIVWGARSAGTRIISQNSSNTEIGIVLSSAQNIRVEKCEVIGNSVRGIQLSYTSWIGDIPDNNTIINCTISGNAEGIFIRSGTGSVGQNNKISWNSIYGNTIGLNNTALALINATYNWWGGCNGPSGIGNGTGDSVFGNASFAPWFGACAVNKIQTPACISSTDNVTLYANVSSFFCIANVTFGVNSSGVWRNFTGAISISGIGNYSIVVNSSFLNGGETVQWTVYAQDCYGYLSQDGIRSFYVNRRTNLSINPFLPDGFLDWYITMPTFTLANPDALQMWYRWNARPEILYISPFNQSTADFLIPPEKSGILELNYWSTTSCGNETPQQKIVKVDLTLPTHEKLWPKPGYIITNPSPIISAEIWDVYFGNSGIDKQNIKMLINGGQVNPQIISIESGDIRVRVNYNATLGDGFFIVNLSSEDKAGNQRSERTWNFTINTSAGFNLRINSPVNKSYSEPYSKDILIDIELDGLIIADGEVAKLEYYDNATGRWTTLCARCLDYNRTKSFKDGWHEITIKAIDAYGNSKQESRKFFVDSKKPRISKIMPRNRETINGSSFYIKYSEENLKNITLYWVGINGSGNKALSCEAGNNKNCITFADFDAFNEQYIDYWFVISDYLHDVSSRVNRVKVDTFSPVLNVISPQNINYSRRVLFNITVSEKVKLEYIDYSSFSPAWTSLCSNCDKYARTRRFSIGAHNLLIKAADKAGNSIAEQISFIV